MSTDPRPDGPEPTDALDQLDAETVEDLDADEDATDVHGGPAMTTGNCFPH